MANKYRFLFFFLHILIFYLIISNQRHSIIYRWISKSNSSKESCCEVEYEVSNCLILRVPFFCGFIFAYGLKPRGANSLMVFISTPFGLPSRLPAGAHGDRRQPTHLIGKSGTGVGLVN